MPLLKLDLDIAAAHGCQVPGCRHENHDATLFIHGHCHPRARVDAFYARESGILQVLCPECGQLITNIRLARAAGFGPLRCHPKAGLDVSYTKGSGILRVTCPECGQPLAEVRVAVSSGSAIER